MKRIIQSLSVALLGSGALFFPFTALAGGCEDYPYSDGMNVENLQGGTKILATASASASFDDVDSIKDAKDDATMEAKAMISKFMTETIHSDEAVNKVVNESKSMTGTEKKVLRTELVERVKSYRNSSRALLRGVVVLGDCYTKGTEVRVSVGIKPETIAGAGKLAGSISDAANNRTPVREPSSAPARSGTGAYDEAKATGLQGRDNYSNTKRLDNF